MVCEAKLCLESPREEDGGLVFAASLAAPDGHRHRLWYRLPTDWRDAVVDPANAFVLAFIFPLMRWGRSVRVEGRASPSLLANLEQFMAIWSAWAPERYRPITIHADEEREPPLADEPGSTVMPFSAGVDSCFTAWRHTQDLVGRRSRNIGAAVTMHGFDIWLDEPNARSMYDGLREGAERMLDNIGVPVVPMATNFHELPTTWKDSLGTHLVAGLMLLQGRFDHALIPNCIPYTRLYIPWGNHPLATPFMGGERFRIADDGGECGRFEKIRTIAAWPEALEHLRVCFENPGSHRNCCRCEKCVRTILSFRAAGLSQPPAFSRALASRDIKRVRFHHLGINTRQITEIIEAARARGLANTWWARAARAARRRNRRRHAAKRIRRPFVPIRNVLRAPFRRSALTHRRSHPRAS